MSYAFFCTDLFCFSYDKNLRKTGVCAFLKDLIETKSELIEREKHCWNRSGLETKTGLLMYTVASSSDRERAAVG